MHDNRDDPQSGLVVGDKLHEVIVFFRNLPFIGDQEVADLLSRKQIPDARDVPPLFIFAGGWRSNQKRKDSVCWNIDKEFHLFYGPGISLPHGEAKVAVLQILSYLR